MIDSWVGSNTVIVGNINVGKNCVFCANSVVTKDIPDCCVIAGVPTKTYANMMNFQTPD